ncbi:basic amino acid ABC transporter substrate-binding protein [Dethiobacter alkaliphilus]|uniref:basic amino acid ABC transporter substrate-binding protein n=1 Tax=Dethiobacter alkaliphilus TaxID=427926 RepID=UPI002227C5BE|nr:basic amino acid ABC transporter substrate-binding protein [Dethiobacter alkaliphilus]MCW3491047.1 basic amino acid ABC transporter substrate-binding protein [Dethiobacter alkaliphilus]
MKKFKWLALCFVLVLALGVLAGCGNNEANNNENNNGNDNGEPAEALIMGTNAEFAPFEFINDDNEYDGFDVDMAKMIADELGMELEIDNMAFDGLISAVLSERVDMAVAAMTITEERQEEVNFSDPYINAGQVIVVLEDNDEIQSVEDLQDGKSVAVQLGTTGDIEASRIVDDSNIVRLQQINAAFMELETGRVDAVIVDNPVAQRYINTMGSLKMVGEPLTEEYYGIAVNKDNTDLLEQINQALANIKEDGRFDELIVKWFADEE